MDWRVLEFEKSSNKIGLCDLINILMKRKICKKKADNKKFRLLRQKNKVPRSNG